MGRMQNLDHKTSSSSMDWRFLSPIFTYFYTQLFPILPGGLFEASQYLANKWLSTNKYLIYISQNSLPQETENLLELEI